MANSSSQPGASATSDSALKYHSCALCRRRKVKCDKKTPCSNCVAHQVACVPAESVGSRPRKKRFPEAELLARIRKYEAALSKNGIDIDEVLNGDDPGFRNSQQRDEETDTVSLGDASSETGNSLRGRSTSRFATEENGVSPLLSVEHIRAREDHSVEYIDRLDTLLTDSAVKTVKDLPREHPPLSQIFTLWQAFIDNVHPILKVIHVPTVQHQVLKATSNLHGQSASTHALLFSIYAVAASSLSPEFCREEFNTERITLVRRFFMVAYHGFAVAQFSRSNELTVLQAFVLLLHVGMKLRHPLTLVTLTGIADRMARRLGLHRNVTNNPQMTQLEVEMRRRVWWQVALIDTHAAEMSGGGLSLLDSYWTTRLPLNVNETDLVPGTEELPESVPWATDAICMQVRCHIVEFLRLQWPRRTARPGWQAATDPVMILKDELEFIEGFEGHLEKALLSFCDPQVPLHLLTRLYAMYCITKMKIRAFRAAEVSERRPQNSTVMDACQAEIMRVCTNTIEMYNQCTKVKALQRFSWFSWAVFPFLCYIHLFSCLQTQPVGETADRAWRALLVPPGRILEEQRWFSEKVLYHGDEIEDFEMQQSFASLAVGAWEARRRAVKGDQKSIPDLILRMQEKLKTKQVLDPAIIQQGSPDEAVLSQPIDLVDESMGHFLGVEHMPNPMISTWAENPAEVLSGEMWTDVNLGPFEEGWQYPLPEGGLGDIHLWGHQFTQ